MTKRYAAVVSLPVVIKSENAPQTVKGEFPKRIEAKLEAEGWKLLSLYLGRAEWVVDLGNELAKDYLDIETLPKAAQYIKPFPEGMKVLEVEPPTLELALDEKVTKRVPIRLAATLQAQSGYVIRPNLTMQPESLTISGPRSALDTISFWNTVPSAHRGLANEFQLELPLEKRAQWRGVQKRERRQSQRRCRAACRKRIFRHSRLAFEVQASRLCYAHSQPRDAKT